METDRIWTVTTVNGKISSVAPDYSGLLRVAGILSGQRTSGSKSARAAAAAKAVRDFSSVMTEQMDTAALKRLGEGLAWDDLHLFGTEFQTEIWHRLFDLNHGGATPKMFSYSEFAHLCGRPSAVRAVAHAVAMNPVPLILPCHRIVPKEAIDRIAEIQTAASKTIFNGSDVWLFDSINFGEYSLGSAMKRELLAEEFSYGIPED